MHWDGNVALRRTAQVGVPNEMTEAYPILERRDNDQALVYVLGACKASSCFSSITLGNTK